MLAVGLQAGAHARRHWQRGWRRPRERCCALAPVSGGAHQKALGCVQGHGRPCAKGHLREGHLRPVPLQLASAPVWRACTRVKFSSERRDFANMQGTRKRAAHLRWAGRLRVAGGPSELQVLLAAACVGEQGWARGLKRQCAWLPLPWRLLRALPACPAQPAQV